MKLIETRKKDSEIQYALSNGTVGRGVNVSLKDLEGFEEFEIDTFLSSLGDGVTAKFHFKAEIANEALGGVSRERSLKDVGFVKNSLNIFVEKQSTKLSGFKKLRKLSDEIEEIPKISLPGTRSLDEKDILGDRASCIKTSYGLDFSSHVVGVLRLRLQSPTPTPESLLSDLKDRIPLPFELRVGIKKVPDLRAMSLLTALTNQMKTADRVVDQEKAVAADEALAEISLHGEGLYFFEALVVLKRFSEKTLREDMFITKDILRPMGEVYIETFGAYPSYISSLPGEDLHAPILERASQLKSFLPYSTKGSSKLDVFDPATLLVHRLDGTPYSFNVFGREKDNYSLIVTGKSGRGKSVFTNLLTRALLNDKDLSIIKIDVGGSHSKETKDLGGLEFEFSLEKPSGINPFTYLRSGSQEEINVLAALVGVLILEEGEVSLSKKIKGELEESLFSYAKLQPEAPSIDDYIAKAPGIPRKNLLKRWAKGGVFENALSQGDEAEYKTNERLRYFNFSKIFQASDPDFGQGGLAIVMAQFNMELIHGKASRVVFICDETPFFIKRCFDFFKFSTANVRKYGGSFITISQKLTDLVVGGDTGIIDNSSSKVFFSLDWDEEIIERSLQLSPDDIATINNLQKVDQKYSECFCMEPTGNRVLRLRITPEEYWAVTSKKSDNEKLDAILTHVPGLTLPEAIKCLITEKPT